MEFSKEKFVKYSILKPILLILVSDFLFSDAWLPCLIIYLLVVVLLFVFRSSGIYNTFLDVSGSGNIIDS
jgi:hypothetical protein